MNMSMNIRPNCSIIDLFDNNSLVKVCAPMVRYSKLQFRNLVKNYGCDLCYTPMIVADSFCKSDKARDSEFTTNSRDTPLITQFAANTVHDFVGAAYLVSPYCDGVDLNCGCPQTWARQMGLGCALLSNPNTIYDIIHRCRNQITKPFTVSVKMRILKDLKKTVEICRQLEKAGVSFLAIHARPSSQLTGDINIESLKLIQEVLNIPLIANGGIKTLEDCYHLQEETGCKGVMVANGILTNPTLFSGSNVTTRKCIQDWLNICYNSTLSEEDYSYLYMTKQEILPSIPPRPNNLAFQVFHHHLVFMMEKLLTRRQRQIFNNYRTFDEVLEFLQKQFVLYPQLFTPEEFASYKNIATEYHDRQHVYESLKPSEITEIETNLLYDPSECDGKYFKSKILPEGNNDGDDDSEDNECDWAGLFSDGG